VLKNENKALRKKIEDINRDQVALHVQVERLQDELAAEYLRYRDECDARKLLIADINDLRFQQEESREAAKQFQDDGETERDDPHMLKIALK
jgi:predicted transcriptional regulator